MSQDSENITLQTRIEIKQNREEVFNKFLDSFSSWYPREYTWAQESLDTIQIEPAANGRCFERGPLDFECDWGRVLEYEKPEKVVFTWQISPGREPVPDPEKAGEVEIRFKAVNENATEITLEHRNFERYGDEAQEYRDAMASSQGWPYILDSFRAFVMDG